MLLMHHFFTSTSFFKNVYTLFSNNVLKLQIINKKLCSSRSKYSTVHLFYNVDKTLFLRRSLENVTNDEPTERHK